MSAAATKPSQPAPLPEVLRLLHEEYGELPWRPHGDPIAELILTILSQHTSDTNSGKAFSSLLASFSDWDAICRADPQAISAAIRGSGLAQVKGPRIKQVLERIKAERGDYDLSFLRELPLDTARAWLTALPGVGPKTAACVLLFAIGHPALPVDTHVFRVAGRLGLLPPKASAEAAHTILERIVPPADVFAFHTGLIKHGRRVCRAPRPLCGSCILARICPSADPVTMPKGVASSDTVNTQHE